MSDPTALPALPEPLEIALADVLEQQFRLGQRFDLHRPPKRSDYKPAADAIQRLCDLLRAALAGVDAESPVAIAHDPATCDREADRKRFPDAAFNRWLDEGISDSGHTVWDAVGDVQSAWSGWQNREFYDAARSADREMLRRMAEQIRGYMTLLETLRTKGESRYCYVESRAGQMVHVADALDAGAAVLRDYKEQQA